MANIQDENNNTPKNFFVQSLDRALKIINLISDEGNKGMTLMEISSQVELPTSTVYRLLHNLLRWNYVSLNNEGQYYLGLAFLTLGNQVSEKLDLVNVARPFLTDLNEKCGETIYLSVFDEVHNSALYVDKRPGKGNIRLVSTIGNRNGVYCSATGKALLFCTAERDIRSILSKVDIVAKTRNTITDVDRIIHDIKESRKRGYAMDLEESEYNVACIAAPIISNDRTVVAAVSISGLVPNITHPIRFDEFKLMLLDTATRISQALGMN